MEPDSENESFATSLQALVKHLSAECDQRRDLLAQVTTVLEARRHLLAALEMKLGGGPWLDILTHEQRLIRVLETMVAHLPDSALRLVLDVHGNPNGLG